MKTYRVVILGCRSRGTAAARVYHAHPRTEVVGLCDLLQDRLDTLGDELNVSARFTDLDEIEAQIDNDIKESKIREIKNPTPFYSREDDKIIIVNDNYYHTPEYCTECSNAIHFGEKSDCDPFIISSLGLM